MAAGTLAILAQKTRRDGALPWHVMVRKGVRYLWELTSARWRLRAADVVGMQARTLGRPRIENFGRLEVGDHLLLRSVNVPVELCTGPAGTLRIGHGVRLNYGVSISAEAMVTIGDRVRVGPYVMIVDSDFHDPYHRATRPTPRPVVIEDDVWIGAKASVLRGVRIGRGAIVGTAAVVTRDVPPFTIVAGVPARAVGELDPARFIPEHAG